MNIWVLIVVMHVNSGSIINFQEFHSADKCWAAQEALYKERDRTNFSGLRTAFCVAK